MAFMPTLSSFPFFNNPEDEELRVHLDDSLAMSKLSGHLASLLLNSRKNNPPVIICIGTDRSTGDCLGPLTGWRLEPLLRKTSIDVFGTLELPVHAQNLDITLNMLASKYLKHPVIAIDACLGRVSSVGTVLVKEGPLQPGTGLGKELPSVGDISISGIVNIGGFMDLQILQSTRLNLVLKMSQLIAGAIYLAVQQNLARA